MTFYQIIWVFPLVALANRLIVEFWRRGSLFKRPRTWVEARGGVWWADVLNSSFSLTCLIATIVTLVMFLTMEGLNGTNAQFAFVYALALIYLPQAFVPFSRTT